ncbi:hypothetical protein GE09DRAFT_1272764, partial [Coniochaeta sp. 2T2.1]
DQVALNRQVSGLFSTSLSAVDYIPRPFIASFIAEMSSQNFTQKWTSPQIFFIILFGHGGVDGIARAFNKRWESFTGTPITEEEVWLIREKYKSVTIKSLARYLEHRSKVKADKAKADGAKSDMAMTTQHTTIETDKTAGKPKGEKADNGVAAGEPKKVDVTAVTGDPKKVDVTAVTGANDDTDGHDWDIVTDDLDWDMV